MGHFTYFSPEARTIFLFNFYFFTKLIAYKTTNTIKHHLKPRRETRDMYNQSGVYQLQCGQCPFKYTGQAGHTFKIRYKEHINTIRTNRQNNKFAQHILGTGHDRTDYENITCRKERAQTQHSRKVLYI
jgi:hypothetical protein